MERATHIAVAEIRKFLEANALPEKVFLVCFGKAAFDFYARALTEKAG